MATNDKTKKTTTKKTTGVKKPATKKATSKPVVKKTTVKPSTKKITAKKPISSSPKKTTTTHPKEKNNIALCETFSHIVSNASLLHSEIEHQAVITAPNEKMNDTTATLNVSDRGN